MIKSRSKVPKFVTYCGLNLIRGSLRRKCGYDVLSCSPIDLIDSIRTPSLFIIGEKDDMVLYRKFLKMFEKSRADKKKLIVQIDAGHPDARTEECIDQVLDFINADMLTESEMQQDNLSNGEKKASIDDIFGDSTKSQIHSNGNSPMFSRKTLDSEEKEKVLESSKKDILEKQGVAD